MITLFDLLLFDLFLTLEWPLTYFICTTLMTHYLLNSPVKFGKIPTQPQGLVGICVILHFDLSRPQMTFDLLALAIIFKPLVCTFTSPTLTRIGQRAWRQQPFFQCWQTDRRTDGHTDRCIAMTLAQLVELIKKRGKESETREITTVFSIVYYG